MSSVLITVTGPDRPGVTGVLFSALAAHRVEVLDIDQAVIRGQLTLGVLVGIQDDPESLQEDVEHAMASVRMTVRVGIDQPGDDRRRFPTHAVVVLGPTAAGQRDRRAGPAVRHDRRQHRGDQADRRLPGHRSRTVGARTRRRAAAGGGGGGRHRDRRGHRGRAGRHRPTGQAADRVRRRLHADHRRGDRDAGRAHRHQSGRRGDHHRRDARRARLRRSRCGPGWPC